MANAFNGGTSTCFCFGQPASGKTFTLFGAGGGLEQQGGTDGGDHGGGGVVAAEAPAEADADSSGIYMMAATDMFQRLEAAPAALKELYYYTRPHGPPVPYGDHLVSYRAVHGLSATVDVPVCWAKALTALVHAVVQLLAHHDARTKDAASRAVVGLKAHAVPALPEIVSFLVHL